jgi:hypothetical protein
MGHGQRRSDALIDKERLLPALGASREVLIDGLRKAKAGGPLYHSISAVVAALTGWRRS